ncbi:prion-inhibition and propagation-domain-containing protein [Aspergillus spectabilis]
MDPIGVALGTAALLSTVLDVFRLVTSFRSYVEASGILFRQLELEREVLQRWTKEVGLHPLSEVSSTQCAIPTELLPLVHTSVASIGSLLARATSIRAAKGMSEAGVHDLRLVYDTLRSEIVNSQKQSRLSRSLARLGWAIGEEDQLKDLISTIHSYNTSLHNLIPKPLQVSLDGSLMQIILAERDENRLLEIQQASSHWRKALSVAASVTVLQQRRPSAAPPSSNQLLIPRSKLSSVGSDLSRHFTQYASGTDKVDVLIEWRAYRIPRNSGQKPYYLNTYLDLARLLHASQSLPAYRTLDCLGIIDDVEFQPHPRIGLVYRVPSITLSFSLGNSVRAHTLYDQINGKEFARPRLEQRFELARSLATGLHRLFVSRWYHKNLNSKNILFFARGNSTDDKSLVPNSEYIHSCLDSTTLALTPQMK